MPAPTAHDFKQNLNDGALRDIVAVSPELSLNSTVGPVTALHRQGCQLNRLSAKLLKSGCF